MGDHTENNNEERSEEREEGGVATLTKPKTKEPNMYHVILLNDDYTTMEFVVHILKKFFYKNLQEATRVMLKVHQEGRGVCGLYPYDVAETKVMQVNEYARQSEMPLKCVMEKS